MLELLIFLITVTCIVISERLLNKFDQVQHHNLGGQKMLISLPSQLAFMGYLLLFQHKNLWPALGLQKIFIIIASVGQWLCIGIVFNVFISQLKIT